MINYFPDFNFDNILFFRKTSLWNRKKYKRCKSISTDLKLNIYFILDMLVFEFLRVFKKIS